MLLYKEQKHIRGEIEILILKQLHMSMHAGIDHFLSKAICLHCENLT